MKSLLLCSFLFGLAFATPIELQSDLHKAYLDNFANKFETRDEKGQLEMVNEYVDMILLQVRTLMIDNGLDPMNLPDFHKRISYKPIIITYWGELNLTDGWLQDASTIARNGDCSIQYENKVLKVEIPVKFKDFLFDYKYKVRIMGFGPSGGIDGKAVNVRIKAKFNLDFNERKLTLENFDAGTGKISMSFNGHGLFDWMINIMTSAITIFFKGILVNILEVVLKGNLEEAIVKINDLLAQSPSYIL